MRLVFLLGLLVISILMVQGYEDNNFEDDDFAEFEQFDADEEASVTEFEKEEEKQQQKSQFQDDFQTDIDNEDDLIVEDEDNEFEHFQDPEEFEGFNDAPPKTSDQPKITITEVPLSSRARWDAYWLEGIFCCLLAFYAMAYVVGRSQNTSIAVNFLKVHKPLLDENFTLVGEMGSEMVGAGAGGGGWRREAEHVFTLWCSGRQCCEGMLLTLKLYKRQDLVSSVIGLFRPSPDTLLIRVELGKEDGDPFVLCVAQKKLATKLAKEMQDLSVFCPEKRPGDKHGLPDTLAVLSESAEATAAVLDSRVTQALTLYHQHLQYIHISDKFCGPKQMEETASTKPPETERVMLVSITVDEYDGEEPARALLCLTLYLTDKIKRLHLSKEALSKCEKRRQKVSEVWMKGAHAALQEQAAARREEKRKQEKERILAEDDPEKQRRWELKEQKRQLKRKTPKMKQLKVKAL